MFIVISAMMRKTVPKKGSSQLSRLAQRTPPHFLVCLFDRLGAKEKKRRSHAFEEEKERGNERK